MLWRYYTTEERDALLLVLCRGARRMYSLLTLLRIWRRYHFCGGATHSKKGQVRPVRSSSSRPIPGVHLVSYVRRHSTMSFKLLKGPKTPKPVPPEALSHHTPPHPVAHVMTFMNYKQCHVDAPLRALYLLPPRPTCTNHPTGYLYKNAGIVFTSASRRTTTRYVPKRNMNRRLVLADVYSTPPRILSEHPSRVVGGG